MLCSWLTIHRLSMLQILDSWHGSLTVTKQMTGLCTFHGPAEPWQSHTNRPAEQMEGQALSFARQMKSVLVFPHGWPWPRPANGYLVRVCVAWINRLHFFFAAANTCDVRAVWVARFDSERKVYWNLEINMEMERLTCIKVRNSVVHKTRQNKAIRTWKWYEPYFVTYFVVTLVSLDFLRLNEVIYGQWL